MNDKTTSAIIRFFQTNENVNDTDVHKLAEQLKINPHEFEGIIYSILSSFLYEGKNKIPQSPDPDTLKKAINIEMEHTTNPELAQKIVFDHVRELGWDYYKELPKMEEKIRNKKGMNLKGEITKVAKELSTFEKNQKSTAIKTLKMNNPMLGVMGGMSKDQAKTFLKGIGYTDKEIKNLEQGKTASIKEEDIKKLQTLKITKKDVEDQFGRQKFSTATNQECLDYCKKTGVIVHVFKDIVTTNNTNNGEAILWLTTQPHGVSN